MKARVEKGYYVFCPPVGYKYGKDRVHGKILVPDEPVASIVAEALEGYASGRFSSQTEIKRFLESKPDFPKSTVTGIVRITKITEMLQRPTYAGYVESPNWAIALRKGHHEPLISFQTYERIQARLKSIAVAPARKDINMDFPLRGFVLCDDCGEPMTSCWSKGRKKHYAYYLCDTPDCPSKRKSIPRAKIEEGAEEILRQLQPTRRLFKLARTMFEDGRKILLAEAERGREALRTQIIDTEREIETVLERIVDTSSKTMIKAYEARIEKLERQKIRLTEQAENCIPSKGHLNEFIEHALTFLASPWTIYEKGEFALKRTVLKLAFAEPLRYSREKGYRTVETAFPFKVLAEFSLIKCGMVEPRGIEPLTSTMPL